MNNIFSASLTLMGIASAVFVFVFTDFQELSSKPKTQENLLGILWVVGVLSVFSGIVTIFAHIILSGKTLSGEPLQTFKDGLLIKIAHCLFVVLAGVTTMLPLIIVCLT